MLLQDIRYALRGLWHAKGFAVVAILCLGFGIGVNTTIFSVMDGVLLQPYPYPEPDRIRIISETNVKLGNQAGLAYLAMRDWKAANTSFTTIAASVGRSFVLSDGGKEPDRYQGNGVSWDLFPMLGANPILGHGFTQQDDRPGGGGVVLLNYDVWRLRYQSDPKILGRTVLINGKPHVVVGVMAQGFAFPNQARLWVPLTPLVEKDPREARNLFAFGRLKPGVTVERAQQDLNAIAVRLAQEYPATNENWTAHLQTLRERFLPSDVPIIIYAMMTGVTLVLFIACSNVANLLLARATSRRKEIALRTALGAGRGRIIRQLLTESVVLALASVPLGVLLAELGTRLMAADLPPDQIPYYVKWSVDARSLAYTVVVAVGTALLFGLFPALQVSRGSLHESLKEGTRGNSARRSMLRSSLVVAQVALALIALVGALLFVRTFGKLDGANLGFDTTPLMTMRFFLTGEPYDPPDAKLRRVRDVVERVEALGGVQAAFASNYIPLSGGGGGGDIEIEGRTIERNERSGISLMEVSPHFVGTMGLALVRGRDFQVTEGWSREPVAVVNQAMVKRFWPQGDGLGGRFRMRDRKDAPWFTVVGVIPNYELYGLDPERTEPDPMALVPYAYGQTPNTGLTVRVSGNPAAITSAVREALRASDPNVPLFQARTMEDTRRLGFWEYGLYGWVFGTTGVIGLILATVGLYGMLSYSVSQRTQEIGVRIALGAGRRQVLGLVIRHGVILVSIGIAIGLVGAPLVGWSLKSFLFQISPFDPVSFLAVSGLLLVVAFVASYLPARRAMKVDPVVALRGE